jgi:uncharacterized protein YcbX
VGTTVGRVAALFRYPVKSMAAEPLDAVEVSWHGLEGDRRWAFVRPDSAGMGFPWLTLRQNNGLNGYRPRLDERCRPKITSPNGTERDVEDPLLAEELRAHPMKLDRGTFDSAPLSLLTTHSLKSLTARLGEELDVRRFRPNILLEADCPEEDWLGRTVRIGALEMRVDRRDKRCVVVNVDPETGARDRKVLKAIVQERQTYLGVYGTTVHPGRVAVGDPVLL